MCYFFFVNSTNICFYIFNKRFIIFFFFKFCFFVSFLRFISIYLFTLTFYQKMLAFSKFSMVFINNKKKQYVSFSLTHQQLRKRAKLQICVVELINTKIHSEISSFTFFLIFIFYIHVLLFSMLTKNIQNSNLNSFQCCGFYNITTTSFPFDCRDKSEHIFYQLFHFIPKHNIKRK